jgi:hypothetical protein
MTAENEVIIIPSQKARARLPEISLLAAIFEDAVRCVRRTRGGLTHRDSKDAADWIASGRSDWPFSFVNVCDLLGLDAEVVRARLEAGDEFDSLGCESNRRRICGFADSSKVRRERHALA